MSEEDKAILTGITVVIVAILIAMSIGAWGVHEDRENRHELNRQIVTECVRVDDPGQCAEQLGEAL